MDQHILEDFIKSEAPLLHNLIDQAKLYQDYMLVSGIMETVNPRIAAIRLEELLCHDSEKLILKLSHDPKTWSCFVKTIGASAFLFSVVRRSPDLIKSLFLQEGYTLTKDRIEKEVELHSRLSLIPNPTSEDLHRELRRYKEEEFLRIGCRDLTDNATVTDVMAELSDFAVAALRNFP